MDRNVRRSVAVISSSLVIAALVGLPGSAAAADEGTIAFARQLPSGGAEIFTIGPDGSGEQNVPVADIVEDFGVPVWSPDGSKLLITNIVRFDGNGDLLPFRPATLEPDGSNYHLVPAVDAPFDMYCHAWSAGAARLLCGFGGDHPGVFNVRATDGGDGHRLTTNPFGSGDVPWSTSPDGTRFAFLRYRPGPMPDKKPFITEQAAIFIANMDGTNVRQVAGYGSVQAHELASASWSPDGRQIVSSNKNGRLFVVRTDGTGLNLLKLDMGTNRYFAFQPAWSPDGQRIVFAAFDGNQEDLFTARRDGTDVRRLTDTEAFEDGPDWGTAH